MAGARAAQNLDALVRAAANRSVRKFAGQFTADEIPPQPTGKVAEQWGSPASPQEGHRNIQQGMTDLWNWAQTFGRRGGTKGNGFRVEGVQTAGRDDPGFEPVDATMYRITPMEFLETQYGDELPKVLDSMEAAPKPAAIEYPAANSLSEHLENPYFFFMASSPGGKSHVSGGGRNILINPQQARMYGASPNYVAQHEWGHAIAPMHGTLRDGNPQMSADILRKALLENYPDLAANPRILSDFVNKRLAHISETTEVPAYLNHLRRLHYGLTGDALLTPEARLNFITDVAKGPKGELGKPSMKFETMFPGSPTMRHGPNAGSPADGYEKIRQYMRIILPRLTPGQKRDVIETFNKGASAADPNEKVYV